MAQHIDLQTAKERLNRRWRFYNKEFVFDVHSGSFYRLSPVATDILKAVLNGDDQPTILTRLERDFGVDQATLRRDMEAFFNSLRAEGITENLVPKGRP
jgi:hypothetical protein